MPEGEEYLATVGDIVRGTHGSYAIAYSKKLRGSITFSLSPEVWLEDRPPKERGIMVVISRITKKPAGWRAARARFWKPSDDQQLAEEKDQ